MNFWQKYNRIILIVAFLGLCLLLGYLMYVIFFKNPFSSQPEQSATSTPIGGIFPDAASGTAVIAQETGTGGILPENISEPKVDSVALGGITKTDVLLQADIKGIALSANGADLKYYNEDEGKFYQIDKNGEARLLSDQVFHQVENIAWSKTANKAILEYPDGANILYNFDTKKQITLPKHWEDFSFSPASDKIAAKSLALDEDNRWLVVANEDGTKIQAIESLGYNDQAVTADWSPNSQIVAFFTQGENFNEQQLYFIGLNGENFKSTTLPGRGFEGIWSKSGNRMLYSIYSSNTDYKPTLWVVDAQGDQIGANRKPLNINTWAKKCAFLDNDSAVCAVPKNIEPGSGIIAELRNQTNDDLYRINTRTGLKKLLAIPEGNFNINDLHITENGYILFFVDSNTGFLHKINLK